MSLVLAGRWPDKWPLDLCHQKIHPRSIRPSGYLGRAQRPFRWRDAMAALQADPLASAHGADDGRRPRLWAHRRLHLSCPRAQRSAWQHDRSAARRSICRRSKSRCSMRWRKKPSGGFWNCVAKPAHWKRRPTIDVKLTRREMEVLNYLAEGMTSMEISADAEDLKSHRRLVYEQHPG